MAGYMFPAAQTLMFTVDWLVFTAVDHNKFGSFTQAGDTDEHRGDGGYGWRGDDAVSGAGPVQLRRSTLRQGAWGGFEKYFE